MDVFNARYNVFFLDFVDCLGHQRLVAVLREAHELLGPQSLEVPLHLAENQFDWVVVWRVRHVIDELEAVVSHGLLGALRGVGAQVVHEQANLVGPSGCPHALEPLLELFDVYRLLVDAKVFQALLL